MNNNNKIYCLNIDEKNIYSKFKSELDNPTNRTTGLTMIEGECTHIGEGTFNNVCSANLNKNICIEDKKVIIRYSKYKIISEIEKSKLDESVKNALFMSEQGIGPKIYEIQYSRLESVLVVMELFDMDLRKFIVTYYKLISTNNLIKDSLITQTVYILKTMAINNLFCIDIKPGNAVIGFDRERRDIKLRFIDVDSDYCKQHNYLTDKIYNELKSLGYTEYDKRDFIYKFMLILFSIHLHTIGYNYLHEIVKTDVRPNDLILIKKLIGNSKIITKIFSNYFENKKSIDDILNYSIIV